MIPHAVIGLTIGYYNIINILQNIKIKAFVFSILIYNFIDDFNVFVIVRGFGYSGIYLSVKSICVIFIFSLFPSDKIKNKSLSKFLIMLSNYTGGIFYTHIPFSKYLAHYFNEIKSHIYQN